MRRRLQLAPDPHRVRDRAAGGVCSPLQIPVAVADLPEVGMNLQDHANVWLRLRTRRAGHALGRAHGGEHGPVRGRTGPLTSNAAETGGFARTADHLSAPDLQFHFFPGPYEEDGPATAHGFGAARVPAHAAQQRIRAACPHRSAEQAVHPARLLLGPGDMDTMVDGVRAALGDLPPGAAGPALQRAHRRARRRRRREHPRLHPRCHPDPLPPGGHLPDGHAARRRWWTPSCECTGRRACAWWTAR